MIGKNLLSHARLYDVLDILWRVPLLEFSGRVMRRLGGKVVEVHEDHLLLC